MKKIILILGLILSFTSYSQVQGYSYTRTFAKNDKGENVQISLDSSIVTFHPNWQGFKDDISVSPVFLQLLPSANPNGYSTFLDYLNSGIRGKNDINMFSVYWNLMGLSLSLDQKTTINAILTKNYFAVQL